MGILKATGIVSTILALIVVAIALLKQIIAFIGFLTFAIKAIIVLGFIALFLGVGLVVFRSLSRNRREKDKS
jgi:hypothetical protein